MPDLAAEHADVTGRPETFLDVLARRVAADADAPWVGFPGESWSSVGQVWSAGEVVARALLGPPAGLHRADRVLTCLRPGSALVGVLVGVARAGLVEVPVPVDVPVAHVLEIVRDTGCGFAVLGRSVWAARPELADLLDHLRVVLVDDGAAPGVLPDGLPDVADLADRPGALPPLPEPGDPALVMSTSGTTGRPRAVLLPHFAGVRHARRVSASMAYGPADVLLNVFPWNHVNIRHAGLGAALVSGARLVALPRFSASTFWATCRAEGATAFNFMGAVAAILLRAGPTAADRAHGVTRAYGGPAPRWLVEEFAARFGVDLVEAYACTELGDVTSTTVARPGPGTAGHPLPEYEVHIRDDAGHAVGPGEVGRIVVRPRVPNIRAIGTSAGRGVVDGPAGPEEWTVTGDRGRWDPAGRLVFAGRDGDVVRRRGENISAFDVETVAGNHPRVREAAAVGVASEFTEQDLLLVVVPVGTASLAPEVVHAWCRERLQRHAWPRYVVVLPDLPRNANGKTVKADLADMVDLTSATDFEETRLSTGIPTREHPSTGAP